MSGSTPFSELKIGSESLSYVENAKVLAWPVGLFILGSLKRFGFDKSELPIVFYSDLRPVLEYMLPLFGIQVLL